MAGISLLTLFISVGLTLGSAGLLDDSGKANEGWARRVSLHAEHNAMLIVVVVVLGCGAGFQVIKLSRRLAAVSEDHAELLRIKQSFEEANRARSEFLSQLSHDIRTPVAGILGMTALALETDLTEEQRGYLADVKSSAESLLCVVVDHCDFPIVDSVTAKLEKIDFELQDIVDRAAKPQEPRAQEKGLRLVCHVMPDVPPALVGDPARLRQVLSILISSAVNSTERGEVVLHVQLERQTPQDVWLRFAVQDPSGGLSPERGQVVAEALLEGATGKTNPVARAGRNLSVAAHLVAQMGGGLRLVSVAGAGNTFHFTIGFGVPAGQVRGMTSVVPSELKELRVLVVDHNASHSQKLAELLGHWQMRPTIVSSGHAALTAIRIANDRNEPFGLALIDANLTGINGFDVAREIAGEPSLAQATILMIDSDNLHAVEKRCRELGVAEWVLKPIRQSELLDAVTMAIRWSRELDDSSPDAARSARRKMGDKLRVLLIEDNLVNQKVASFMLKKRGHDVEIAGNGLEALAALAKRNFDVILMDLQMPDLDGFETTARIREDELATGRHVPIVAVTAHALPGDREKCLAAGMDGYLSKPIITSELHATIESVMASAGSAAAAAGRGLVGQSA
jgi:CheY-like chemotaxis protein/signal transduction histidine kinase